MADEKLVKAVRVRLTEDELKEAKIIAKARGMTVSQLFRLSVKKEISENERSIKNKGRKER